MVAKIYPAAKARMGEIWDYTERKWGEDQADRYVKELVDAINGLRNERHCWKPVRDDALRGFFFFRYRHHYIFFRVLPSGAIGVVSVLHENMDLPNRLKEDVAEDG